MFNQAAINDCFKNLIGFEQNPEGLPQIDNELLVSESGMTVQQLHPLLSIENLDNCAQVIGFDLDTYLSNRRNTALNKLINAIYSAKQLNENSAELLTEVRMFEGVGNFNDKVVKLGRFVGFRVNLIHDDISILLRHIGLQIDTENPHFKLYIYHSSKSDPIAVIDIAHNKAVSFTWFNFDKKILQKVSGGGYLIGYYENDLIGQAIKREQFFLKKPACSSCNAVNYELYNKWSKFLTIQPFYVDAINLHEDKTKWEEINEILIDGNNFGLNLAISVICDVSGLFCRNREIFIDALGKQIAVEFLNDIAYSMRDNQAKQKLSQMAFYALGNKENNTPGMTLELDRAIKALNFNTSDLNPICLPCQDNYYRVKHSTTYR